MFDYPLFSYKSFRIEYLTTTELVDRFGSYMVTSGSSWNKQQKCRFIESLLLGMPTAPVFADDNNNGCPIIQGIEMVKTIVEFMDGSLQLESLFYSGALYDGRGIHDLSPLASRKLINYKFQVCTINPGIDNVSRYGIHSLLQTRLDADSISRCRGGIFTNYHSVKELAIECKEQSCFKGKLSTIEDVICKVMMGTLLIVANDEYDSVNCQMDLFVAHLLNNNRFDDLLKSEGESLRELMKYGFLSEHSTNIQALYFIIALLIPETKNCDSQTIKRLKKDFQKAIETAGKARLISITDIQMFRDAIYKIRNLIIR